MSIYQMAPVMGPVIAPISKSHVYLQTHDLFALTRQFSWRLHRTVHDVEVDFLVHKLVLSCHSILRLHRPSRNLHTPDPKSQSPASAPGTSKSIPTHRMGRQNVVKAASS